MFISPSLGCAGFHHSIAQGELRSHQAWRRGSDRDSIPFLHQSGRMSPMKVHIVVVVHRNANKLLPTALKDSVASLVPALPLPLPSLGWLAVCKDGVGCALDCGMDRHSSLEASVPDPSRRDGWPHARMMAWSIKFVDFKYVIEMVCHYASVSLLTGCGKSLCYAIFPQSVWCVDGSSEQVDSDCVIAIDH